MARASLLKTGSDFASRVIRDVGDFVKQGWIGCYQWQVKKNGDMLVRSAAGFKRYDMGALSAIADEFAEVEEDSDDSDELFTIEEQNFVISMYVRLEPSIVVSFSESYSSVRNVFNISNINIHESLTRRGFFKGVLTTLEAWMDDVDNDACSCILVQNIINSGLKEYLSTCRPMWRSPDEKMPRSMDRIRLRVVCT